MNSPTLSSLLFPQEQQRRPRMVQSPTVVLGETLETYPKGSRQDEAELQSTATVLELNARFRSCIYFTQNLPQECLFLLIKISE